MTELHLQIRDKWVPDALAQLKFSPKLRSAEIEKILQVIQSKEFCSEFIEFAESNICREIIS